MTKKLHIEASETNLQELLTDFGATVTNSCLLFSPTGISTPLAVLSVREITATQVVYALICNRPPVGLVVGDFVITGPVNNPVLTGGPQLFLLTMDRTGFGTVGVSLPMGFAEDPEGNDFPAISAVNAVLTRRPIPTITGPTQVGFLSEELTITFDEAVTGLSLGDFSVEDGTLTNLAGSGTTYTVDLTVAIGETNTQVLLPAYRVINGSSQPNVSSNVYQPIVAHQQPTPTIVPTQPVFGTLSTVFTITWDVDVTAEFDSSMLTITNGTLDSLDLLYGNVYQANITAGVAGTVELAIAADEFSLTGYAGNAAGSGSCTVDLSALTFSLTGPVSSTTREFSVIVTGSKPHYGVTLAAFAVSNAEPISWTAAGNGGTLLLVVAEYPGEYDVSVRLSAGSVRTASGYNLASNTVVTRHDSIRPTLAVSGPIRQGSQLVYEITTTELLVYFSGVTSDAGSVVVSGTGYRWLATVTPTAASGLDVLRIEEGAFTDQAGNPCYPVATDGYVYDFVGPIGDLALVADGHSVDRPTNKTQRQLFLDYNKDLLTDLTHDQVVLSPGVQLIDFEVVTDRRQYSLLVEVSVPSTTVTVTIPAGVVQDTLGNFSQTASVLSYVFDGIPPTYLGCTITDNYPNILWAFSLSESVTLNDYIPRIITLGVRITDVTSSGSELFVTGTPTQSGNVGVKLLAGLANDVADNPTPETGFFYIQVDSTGPRTVITSPQSPSTSNRFLTFRIEFDELISRDLVREDLSVINAVLNPVTVPGTKLEALTPRRVYEAIVSAMVEGPVTLSIDSDRVHDLRGNGNSAATLTVGYVSTFSVLINAESNEYLDQRVLQLVSTLPIDAESYTSGDFHVLSTPLGRVQDIDAAKILLLAPNSTRTTVTVPAGAVSSTNGRTNQAASLTLNYIAFTTVVTLTSETPEAIVHTPVVVDVEFSTYVDRVNIDQFQAAIRTDDLQPESPTVLDGEFTAFEVLEPGYLYRVTYVARIYPTSLANDLHIWHEATNDGTIDVAGNKVTHEGYVRIPLRRPFAAVISSSQSPETFDQLITFVINFPSQLTTALDISDIILDNATTDVVGTGLTVGSNNSQYTLIVQAVSAGNVEVTIPAAVVTNLGGEANVQSSAIVAWIGDDRYPLTIDIGPGVYSDQRLVTVRTSYPMDHSQVTLGSLNYNSAIITLLAEGPMQFIATLKPGQHTTSIVIPENSYTAYDGRTNHRATATIVWNITDTAPRVTIAEPMLSYPNSLTFIVDWPTKVFNFDASNIVASLRDAQLTIVPGGNTSGTLDATTEIVPGYRYSSKFTLDAAPDNTPHRFYIWCGPPWDVTDSHSSPLTQRGYASVPVAGQFVFVLSSPESPSTGKDLIRFDMRSSRVLAQDLTQASLSVVNGTITAFRPVTRLESYSAWVRPTIKGDVTLTVEAAEITDVTGTPNQETSLTVQYDGSFTVGFAFTPGPRDDIAKVTLTLPGGVSDAPLNDNSLSFSGNLVHSATRVIGEPAFLVHLKLPNGANIADGVVYVAVTLKPAVLTATDGSQNRSQLMTGTIPYVPFAVVPEFTPDPFDFDQLVQLKFVSNWYCNPRILPAATTVGWFQYVNKLTQAPIAGATLLWTPGIFSNTVYEDIPGYEYSINVRLLTPTYDGSLWLPGGIPWYADASFSVVNQQNTLGQYGISRNGVVLTNQTKTVVPVNYPESSHVITWTGGSSLTRHLIVTLEGSLGTQTDAFTVDWGDSTVELYSRSQAHSWTANSAIFHISHTYASSASFVVTVTSEELFIRVTGLEVAKPDDANVLRLVSPGDTTIARIQSIVPNWQLDLRYIGLGNNSSPVSTVLSALTSVVKSVRRLAANFYAADSSVLDGPTGDSPYELYELYMRTDQDVWRMFQQTSPSLRPPTRNEVNLRDSWWQQNRTTLRLELVGLCGTSATYPLVFIFADTLERLEVSGGAHLNTKGLNAAVSPNWYTGPGIRNINLRDLVSTNELKLWEDNFPYNPQHVFETVSIVNCRFSRVTIPWKLVRHRNNPWNPITNPLRLVEVLDHWMTHEEEYNFYLTLQNGVLTDIDSLPPDAVVHTRRNPAMYGSPEANAPTAATYSLVEAIRDILRRVGRPNAYRITLE